MLCDVYRVALESDTANIYYYFAVINQGRFGWRDCKMIKAIRMNKNDDGVETLDFDNDLHNHQSHYFGMNYKGQTLGKTLMRVFKGYGSIYVCRKINDDYTKPVYMHNEEDRLAFDWLIQPTI